MKMKSETFHALADPTRLRIVEVLREGECPVNDIVARVDIHQSGVSRHLRILQEAGFVTVKPVAQQRIYALSAEAFQELDAWVGRYRRIWDARLDRFGKALAAKQAARAEQPQKPN